jgi:SAM-dependent methyltransferase
MAGLAHLPGRSVGTAEFDYICHRHLTASELAKDRIVIDVGCGAGFGLAALAGGASSFFAGDFSQENLIAARTVAGESFSLVRFDAHRLPCRDASVELLLALEVVCLLDFERFAREAARILKPGGILFFTIADCERPDFEPPAGLSRERYPTASQLYEQLRSAGFSAQVDGVFEVHGGVALRARALRLSALRAGAHFLRWIELTGVGLHAVRRMAKRIVRYHHIELPNNGSLSSADLSRVSSVPVSPLPPGVPAGRHVFLYVTATKPLLP